MNRMKLFLPVIIVALFLSGCIDNDDTFTINPDGTGKVFHKALILSDKLLLNMGDKLSEEEKFHTMVKEELQKAKGVDAWSDVTFTHEGSLIRFEGTAYFKNINKLKFHNSGISVGMYNNLKFSEDSGYMTIEITSGKSKEDNGNDASKGPFTEAEITAEIEKQRSEYQKTRIMIAGIMGSMRIKRAFYLPGTSIEVSNFQVDNNGAYIIDIQGSKLVEVMDAMIGDDELMRSGIKSGRNMIKDGPEEVNYLINELMFGVKGPIRVDVEHRNQTLFDYEAEVALARDQFKEIQDKLGIIPEPPAQASPEGAFQVGGVRIVKISDQKNEVRMFRSFTEIGITYSIYGRLPEKALKVTEGKLTALLTDTGEDLLPDSDWDRTLNFPSLSKDGMIVIFDVEIKNLPENARLIKELSATMNYTVGETIKKIDLGFNQFAAGAIGTQFNAKIEKMQANDSDKSLQDIEIKIDKPPEEIINFSFYDTSGNSLEVNRTGWWGGGTPTTFFFSKSDGEFPAQGSITIETYVDLQKKKLSLTLNDLEILKIK